MSALNWYSARLKKVCLIEGKGATMVMKTVYVFRAKNFNDALKRALDLGRASEEQYRNADGQIVRWRFKDVESLDVLQEGGLDGVEVHSEFAGLEAEDEAPFDSAFHPENSKPDQSLGGAQNRDQKGTTRHER